MKKEQLLGPLMFLLACSVLVMLLVGCDMLATRGELTRSGAAFVWDTVTQRQLFLDKAVTATAPDYKAQIIIAPSGKLRWYDLHTGKVFVTTTISPDQYRHAEVRWLSNQRVEIIALLRHPFLLRQMSIILDRDRGNGQETSLYRLTEKRNR